MFQENGSQFRLGLTVSVRLLTLLIAAIAAKKELSKSDENNLSNAKKNCQTGKKVGSTEQSVPFPF